MTEKADLDCIRTDSNVMLDQFDPNQLPTLAWDLIGFTGLAFCQQSEVKGREGRDKYYVMFQGKVLCIKFMQIVAFFILRKKLLL